MRGTEKQIVWANKIIGAFESALSEMEKTPEATSRPQVVEYYRIRLEILKTAKNAWDVIDLFKDVDLKANCFVVLLGFRSVYRVAWPNTEEQKRILMRQGPRYERMDRT